MVSFAAFGSGLDDCGEKEMGRVVYQGDHCIIVGYTLTEGEGVDMDVHYK